MAKEAAPIKPKPGKYPVSNLNTYPHQLSSLNSDKKLRQKAQAKKRWPKPPSKTLIILELVFKAQTHLPWRLTTARRSVEIIIFVYTRDIDPPCLSVETIGQNLATAIIAIRSNDTAIVIN